MGQIISSQGQKRPLFARTPIGTRTSKPTTTMTAPFFLSRHFYLYNSSFLVNSHFRKRVGREMVWYTYDHLISLFTKQVGAASFRPRKDEAEEGRQSGVPSNAAGPPPHRRRRPRMRTKAVWRSWAGHCRGYCYPLHPQLCRACH